MENHRIHDKGNEITERTSFEAIRPISRITNRPSQASTMKLKISSNLLMSGEEQKTQESASPFSHLQNSKSKWKIQNLGLERKKNENRVYEFFFCVVKRVYELYLKVHNTISPAGRKKNNTKKQYTQYGGSWDSNSTLQSLSSVFNNI